MVLQMHALPWHNINPLELSADRIKMDIHGINSAMDTFSANATVTVSLGTHSVSVESKGDGYPNTEVVQYRRAMALNRLGEERATSFPVDDGIATAPLVAGGRDEMPSSNAR
ncbi:hypothetical protein ACIRVF_42055 [Kitasatospora sp. NPDC101157]|uniref:hypothetical protein n=1 Tax=Kitasatospora sp. NPDC101157 TaxID=3364098 RepID=UPI00380B19C9